MEIFGLVVFFFCVVLGSRKEPYIKRAEALLPLNFSICGDKTLNPQSLNVKCRIRGHRELVKNRFGVEVVSELVSCPRGPPDPLEAWLLYCLARALVSSGFQVPTFVIAGPFPERRVRIEAMTQAANISYVVYRDDFLAGKVNKTTKDKFIRTIPSKKNGATEQELLLCTESIDASINNAKQARRECEERGTVLTDREVSLTMKHVAVHQSLLDCSQGMASGTTLERPCFSPGTGPDLRYALVIEDDQFLPTTLLQHIAQLIISAPPNVGLFMIDDSFSDSHTTSPPEALRDAAYPGMGSYEKARSRTCGAYLVSEAALRAMFSHGRWVPQLRVIDHSFNHIIKKEGIVTHWAHPPLTCHGSRGLERDPNGRKNCQRCCEKYYNVATMQPKLLEMLLVDRNNEILVNI